MPKFWAVDRARRLGRKGLNLIAEQLNGVLKRILPGAPAGAGTGAGMGSPCYRVLLPISSARGERDSPNLNLAADPCIVLRLEAAASEWQLQLRLVCGVLHFNGFREKQ